MNAPLQQPVDCIRCYRCAYFGSDVKVIPCGCSVHARCILLNHQTPISRCLNCSQPVTSIELYPMSFSEIDNARRIKAATSSNSGKRSGKKRKEVSKSYGSGSVSEDSQGKNTIEQQENLECRTGRWTCEETKFCDKLIEKFKVGNLPLTDGFKLNDFLATMLKSKQSRLTKKMKNASLSSKTFKIEKGCIEDPLQAREFSEIEDAFFHSISDERERADVKFHMQKEWREMFSSFCVSIKQHLNVNKWLISIEEMDRRASLTRDAARMARRKLMMGIALTQDSQNHEEGVYIDSECMGQNQSSWLLDNSIHSLGDLSVGDDVDLHHRTDFAVTSRLLGGTSNRRKIIKKTHCSKYGWHYASPFLGKIIAYCHRFNIPFEHVDAWVPSFVPNGEQSIDANVSMKSCRLCFAGSATCDSRVPQDVTGPSQPLSQDEQFGMVSFGDYSQKFSFNVGSGLPGRVYESGVPTWEQSVHNAPLHHFERCGGAQQWGIKTVVGIPVPSPNVGRIVVLFYSCFDRDKDQSLVGMLCDEFSKLMPSPKWKLVVEVGRPIIPPAVVNPITNAAENKNESETSIENFTNPNDRRLDDLVSLLGEHMPHKPSSPFALHLGAFMSLRLMLLKQNRTKEENEVTNTLLSSFSSYSSTGRNRADIAVMLSRDFTFLQQLNSRNSLNINSNSQQLFTAAPGTLTTHSYSVPSTTFEGNDPLQPTEITNTQPSVKFDATTLQNSSNQISHRCHLPSPPLLANVPNIQLSQPSSTVYTHQSSSHSLS